MKIHKNTKFKCKICEKVSSSRKDNIRRHIKHLHGEVEKSSLAQHIVEFESLVTENNHQNDFDYDISTLVEPVLIDHSEAAVTTSSQPVLNNRVGVIKSVGNPNRILCKETEPLNSMSPTRKSQEEDLETKLAPKKNPIVNAATAPLNQLTPAKPKYDPIEQYRKILLGKDDHIDDDNNDHEVPAQIHWRKRASQNFFFHQ